jgi:hypothetical protein
MQPHGPYFGDTADELRKQLIENENIGFTRLKDTSSDISEQYADLMYAARNGGYLTPESVREIYTENLKLVLRYAEKLSEQLEGKTVISADHGERLGNPSTHFTDKYGHGGYAPEVRTVPWLELEYERRKGSNRTIRTSGISIIFLNTHHQILVTIVPAVKLLHEDPILILPDCHRII